MEKKKKYILIGLGVVAIGTGAYIYFKKRKNNSSERSSFTDAMASTSLPSLPSTSSSSSSSSRPSSSSRNRNSFPLKRGSYGSNVSKLQNALIAKYGKSILPKYGADGGFGSETVSALKSKGLPTTVTEEVLNQLSKGSSSSSGTGSKLSPTKIAAYLHKAVANSDFKRTIVGLRLIKNVSDYIKINTIFKESRIALVRRTIVTAVLQSFSASAYKKFINTELYRIGLKYNGSQWSLSGISGSNQLVTIQTSKIWDSSGSGMMIPRGTIIGDFQSAEDGVTAVTTIDGKTLFINTNAISYLS